MPNTWSPEKRKEYNKDYYERTKHLHNPGRYARKAEATRICTQFIRDYKSNRPCADCGQSYPYYVMDFDHVRDKKHLISTMVRGGYSLDAIKKEMDKCELVCSNCHRERTFQRAGNSTAE